MTVAAAGLEERIFGLFGSDGQLLADPYPTWNELRARSPRARMRATVVLSAHADVRELLGDNNRLYSRQRTRHAQMYQHARRRFEPAQRAAFDEVIEHEFRQLVRLDPPAHGRQRKAVRAPFTPRALLREMQDKIGQRVAAGLEALAGSGDVVDFKKFAYTLPITVIGDLLGISITDLERVHGWARVIADNKFNADSAALAVQARDAYDALMGYIDELVGQQQAAGVPTGLVASLIEAEGNGTVERAEVKALLGLMIFAGHETTSGLISVGLLELLRHPDQWSLLCDDPALVPNAVEELLRFVTPVQFLPYTAVAPRDLGEVQVQTGDTVIGVLAAANRDPAVFDRPDELDLLRADVGEHLGFGLGPHFCLGASLARMEATEIFTVLARQFPRIQLAPGELRWGGRSLRTPLEMPVRLNP
jgi:cytochrome P450